MELGYNYEILKLTKLQILYIIDEFFHLRGSPTAKKRFPFERKKMFITERYVDGFLHVLMKTGGIILRPKHVMDICGSGTK